MGFSEDTFTEKTFNDMMQRYQKDFVEFLKTETSPDFLFVGTEGSIMNRQAFLAFGEGSDFLTNDFSNLKIRQFGNTAIVTGLWNHSHHLKRNNAIVSYKEAVTETFVQQNGKWIYASHQSGFAPIVKSDEEAAIKAICEKETQAFNNRDADGMLSCHANKPYSLMLVAESGNVHYTTAKSDVDSEKSIKDLMAMMGPPNGDTFLNTGYVIRINGRSAFVYYDQLVTAKDGIKTNFHEVRNLEMTDGKWKIIYVGAVGFKPENK